MQKSQRMKSEIAKVDSEIASLSEMIKCISDEVRTTHISFLKVNKTTSTGPLKSVHFFAPYYIK